MSLDSSILEEHTEKTSIPTSEVQDGILKDLNPQQKTAVQHNSSPLLILAGAGSGKTRTIVHKIAWLIHVENIPPWQIVAVTFTNKAAQEMKQRAIAIAGEAAHKCIIRTYHSLGLYFLRKYASFINYPSHFTIWDESDQQSTLKKLLNFYFQITPNKTELKYFTQTISFFKDNFYTPEDLEKELDLSEYQFQDILPSLYAKYEQEKEIAQAMDFADLNYKLLKLLKEHPEALNELQEKYTYFLVDEYQDTNHVQYLLIQILAQKYQNLSVVGDDDQSIYSWRGADINNILDFQKDFSDVKIVKLEQNYRSIQNILSVSNDLIQHNTHRMDKKLWSDISMEKKPRLIETKSNREEARIVVNYIENLNLPYHEVAILYRTNLQSRLLEEALREKNIAYKIFGGTSFFQRQEIKDILSYLKILTNPMDQAAFIRIINTPTRSLGDKSIDKIIEYKNQSSYNFIECLEKATQINLSSKASDNAIKLSQILKEFQNNILNKTLDFSLFLEDLLIQTELYTMYENEDKLLGTNRIENLNELKNSMTYYQKKYNYEVSMVDYLQDIALYSNTQDVEETPESVNLMTVHNAKGLEFNTVFILSLDEGIFPHYLSIKEGNLEEERRLLYVAITRAKENLYFLKTQERFQGGWYQKTKPSSFLTELPPYLLTSTSTKSTQYQKKKYNQTQFFSKISSQKTNLHTIPNPLTHNPSNSGFKKGDRVKHAKFNIGKILFVEGSGDAKKAQILFQDGKSRKFVLKFTPLEKIS